MQQKKFFGLHFNRLKTLKEEAIKAGAEVLFGGEENEDSRFIGPTCLTLAKQIYPPYHKKFKAHIVKNMIRWF